MRFLYVIPVVFLGMLVGACSSDSSCIPHDSQYCDEGVFYWADSCGNLEDVITRCECGCLPDHSGCDPDCSCTPDCLGKECGDDGCGGTCPPGCPAGEHCSQGTCECDFVTCGSQCCAQGQECYQGACCTPNCQGRECGGNGCGGSCGECGTGEFCDASGQCQGMPTDCRLEPCPSGYYCDLNTGECKEGCISDNDCPQPGSCDLATHSCQCDSGYHLCSDQCLPDDSTDSCGDRCTPCVPPQNGTSTCDGVSCGFVCNTGYHQCGELCLSNNSTDSCGTRCTPCVPPAHATATCDGVNCDFVCDSGYHRCSNECKPNNSVDSCGTRCTPCVPPQNATATCDGVNCDFVCDSGYHRCGDQCPSIYSTDACGASCTPCSPPQNATATCDGTSCGFYCNTGYHQCGSQCLSDTSPNSCGTSCTPCPAGPANSSPACVNGSCDFTCNTGYHRCGDLCYADDDPTHCGPSCTPCTSPDNGSAACINDACDFTCDTGYHRCTDECLWDTSPDSCGTSCTPCPQPPNAYATCDGTNCGYECNSGWHLCDYQCVPDDAVTSCGTSCDPCPAPDPGTAQRATCEDGVCGTGCIDACNATCVDTNSDPAHCGGCNTACGAGSACVEGSCVTTCLSGPGFVDLLPRLMLQDISATDQAPGDLDRDGDIDLVVVGYGGSVKVFMGNGDGTFLPATTYDSMVDSPTRVKLGDFNGDLYPDIATFSNPYQQPGEAALFMNAGNGTFNAPVLRQAQAAIGGVAVGDFNGDNNLDIAVTNNVANSVSLFLGDGAGDLGAAAHFPANQQPYAIAAGEFTSDANLDLVVTNYSSLDTTPWISVLPGDGAGGFGAPIATNGNGSAGYLRVGDVNKDGDLDIVVNHAYDSNLHLGNGDGTFQDPVDLGASDRTGSALADLNNDGNLDWAVNTEGSSWVGTLYVRLGNGDGTFQPVVSQPSVGGSNVDNTSAADYDGDGYADLSILDGSNSIVVYLNDQTGWFPLPGWWDMGYYPRYVTTGDLDGNGSRDALVSCGTTDGRAYPFLGDGAGDFSPGTAASAGSYPYFCATADLDRDGYDDAILTSSSGGINVLYSSATGDLSGPDYYATGSSPQQVAAGDLDGDGWTDLVVANEYDDTVSVLLNDGSGDLVPAGELEAWLGTYGVAVADFNLDGRLDIASGGYDGVEIFMGNGSGSFRYGVTVSTDAYSVEHLSVADFNNDGRPDLAAAQYWDPVMILLGKGNGEFVELLTTEEVSGGLQAADMDRDGNADLIFPGFGILPGNGDGTFTTPRKYLVRSGGSAVAVDDVNDDSYLDVLFIQGESYDLSLALGTCR